MNRHKQILFAAPHCPEMVEAAQHYCQTNNLTTEDARIIVVRSTPFEMVCVEAKKAVTL